jgi:hypothetical protein
MSATAKRSSGETVSPDQTRKRKNAKKTLYINPVLLTEEAGPVNTHWRTYFIDALVATSNVTAACAAAKVCTSRAYRARQQDSDFAREWHAALVQGYIHLEMEVLAYLRNPAPAIKLDVASAIRLLTMHRETVAREQALSDQRSEQEVLESLDAKIDSIRQRRIARGVTNAAPAATEPCV